MHMKMNHDISGTHLYGSWLVMNNMYTTKNLVVQNVYCSLGDSKIILKLLLIIDIKRVNQKAHYLVKFMSTPDFHLYRFIIMCCFFLRLKRIFNCCLSDFTGLKCAN
jgi:hypothetical protein